MARFKAGSITPEQQHARMVGTPVLKLLMTLSVPTVLGQLVTVIYNAADTYFVSQINTSASAAVGVVFSLMSIIQSLGYGIGMGAGSLISYRLGQKKQEDAERYAVSAFAFSFLAGFVIMALGLPLIEPLMRLLGSSETMLPYAVDYGRYILIAAPIMCASFLLNCALRAEGETTLATVGISMGGILNMILDPLLIFSLDLGIAGAAIATAASQCVSFILLLAVYLRGRTIIKLRPRLISRSFGDYGLILSTGFPTICRQGLGSLSAALLNVQARMYGDAAVAAVTIANKVYMLVRNVVIGVGQGFQPIAGYNFGAGYRRRTKKAFLWACGLGTVVCVAAAGGIAVFAEPIMAWFRADDEAVIRIGALALRFGCMVMPFMAYSTYVNQLYQCLGFRVVATLLASMRQGICFVPLILLLPRLFGLTGVQVSQPLSDFLTFFVSIPFQIRFFRRYLRQDELAR